MVIDDVPPTTPKMVLATVPVDPPHRSIRTISLAVFTTFMGALFNDKVYQAVKPFIAQWPRVSAGAAFLFGLSQTLLMIKSKWNVVSKNILVPETEVKKP